MCALGVLLLVLLASARAHADNHLLGDLHALLRDCPRERTPEQQPVRAISRCARRRAFLAIDRILEDDTVPLFQGLQLVRRDSDDDNNSNGTSSLRDLLKRIHERETSEEGKGVEVGWRAELIKRVARVLKTHVIKIDLGRVTTTTSTSGIVEGRGRRRRRRQMQMMPIIMMGVLLMGSVLIPMGFQFLAVLGGKALILAKMALMLSSIQGLKKIATNGVNYGLYHSPIPAVAGGEPWHERSTASVELPSYALSYGGGGHHGSAPYVDAPPGHLGAYITNRRSVAD